MKATSVKIKMLLPLKNILFCYRFLSSQTDIFSFNQNINQISYLFCTNLNSISKERKIPKEFPVKNQYKLILKLHICTTVIAY